MLVQGTIVAHPSLSDQAFAAIADAIAQGVIAPGTRIKEATIARDLGISRGPLREALRRLESHRLVERRPGLGAFVTSLSLDDLDDLFQMREVLEGAACSLAASRISDAGIAELQGLLDRHGNVLAAEGQYRQLTSDDDFHFCIIRESGSRRLFHTLCSELYLQIRMYRFCSSSKPGRAEMAMQEHRDIVAAIAARDARKAEEAMRTHIANARKNLMWTAPEAPQPLSLRG
ncbi:GntR family transcriptional regulator [Agaricicola taiwanensis]|nr:GntR family transcriptional regulator [Agaricicola taiwanensis]